MELAVVRGKTLADVTGVDPPESRPVRGHRPLVLKVAGQGEVWHLVNGAAHWLRRSETLLRNPRINIADPNPEREPAPQSTVEGELKAVALRLSRISGEEVAA